MKYRYILYLTVIAFYGYSCRQHDESYEDKTINLVNDIFNDSIKISCEFDSIYRFSHEGFDSIEIRKVNEIDFDLCERIKNNPRFLSKEEAKRLNDLGIDLREENAFYSITKPVYSDDVKKARFMLTYNCGRYCSHDAIITAEVKNGKWIIVERKEHATW